MKEELKVERSKKQGARMIKRKTSSCPLVLHFGVAAGKGLVTPTRPPRDKTEYCHTNTQFTEVASRE